MLTAGKDKEANFVLLGGLAQPWEHEFGNLDTLFVFSVKKEAGEHHPADLLDVLAVREVLQENRPVMLGGENFPDDGRRPDEIVEIILASRDHLAIAKDFGIGIVELKLLVDRKGTADISIFLMENSSVEIGIDLIDLTGRV